jgi:hypothetical protein
MANLQNIGQNFYPQPYAYAGKHKFHIKIASLHLLANMCSSETVSFTCVSFYENDSIMMIMNFEGDDV